mmetsp:Transcript_64344/g.123838  ORF Transcript_64344/g.123838 Transcript_64344/m.123838 type:complete len:94 (+) Transcript_64344:2-283(+)
MLASSAPVEDIKERLNLMMAPICKDTKNFAYTMSVLKAVCQDFNQILAAIDEGREYVEAPAFVKPGKATKSHSECWSHFPGAKCSGHIRASSC